MDSVAMERETIQVMFKCKHDWEIIHASNVLQVDGMGYPLRLFIQKCSKCGKTEQAWYDVDKRYLEEIKAGRFVLCKWEC